MITKLLVATMLLQVAACQKENGDSQVKKGNDANKLPDVQQYRDPKVLNEDFSSGSLNTDIWKKVTRKWGAGNNGVVAENIKIEQDSVNGVYKNVVVLYAHGDLYNGSVSYPGGGKTRVGALLITKDYYCSGEYEVVMKIGDKDKPNPKGMCPSIWTFAWKAAPSYSSSSNFVANDPLYNPHMLSPYEGTSVFNSEIDAPELGRDGNLNRSDFNTYVWEDEVPGEMKTTFNKVLNDGKYHTYTLKWYTELRLLPNVTDAHTTFSTLGQPSLGYYWINNKSIPFSSYYGNPLKRVVQSNSVEEIGKRVTREGEIQYYVYIGKKAELYIDGEKISECNTVVPSMAAQLNIGVWFPNWAGAANWDVSKITISSVKITPYNNEGDCWGITD